MNGDNGRLQPPLALLTEGGVPEDVQRRLVRREEDFHRQLRGDAEALRDRLHAAGARKLRLRPVWPRLLKVAAGVVASCVLLALAWRWLQHDPMASAYAEVSRALGKEPPAGLRGSDIDEGLLKQLQRFYDAYSLAPGQSLKLIPESRYPPERATYIAWGGSEGMPRLPKKPYTNAPMWINFVWTSDGTLKDSWKNYGRLWPLRSRCAQILGISASQIAGDSELSSRPITGDIVYRPEAPAEALVQELQQVLQAQLGWQVVLSWRSVQTSVVVVTGRYEYKPMPWYAASRDLERVDIDIYGSVRGGRTTGGGGTGDFDKFLNWVGDFVGRPVVRDAVEGAPGRLTWHLGPRPYYDEYGWVPLAEKETALVLQHLKEQTGLDYRIDNREVRMLFVEPSKHASD